MTDGQLLIRPLEHADAVWYARSLDPEILRWSREEPIADPDAWWHKHGVDRHVIDCCGESVGAAKTSVEDDRVEISYWVSESNRGRGYATAALRLLTERAGERFPDRTVELEIHPENTASIRTALNAGFSFLELRSSCDSCADDNGMVAVFGFPRPAS